MILLNKEVLSFTEYSKIDEKIAKSGSKWLVKNRKGTKTLGTHTSRKKALKQLQAIEISKAMHERSLISVNEAEEIDLGSEYLSELRRLEDSEVINKLDEVSKLINHLSSSYWYNREGNTGHYALRMKIHASPDLEEWAKAKGEEDEDDINEDSMYDDWYRFMEDTYEVHSEDYPESFDWIEKIGAGGRSGGWLLVYPEYDHDDIETDLSYKLAEYLDNLPEEDFSIKLVLDPESRELIELGLIQAPDDYQTILDNREEVLEYLNKTEVKLNQINIDLEKITTEIAEFAENAEKQFYEWIAERT